MLVLWDELFYFKEEIMVQFDKDKKIIFSGIQPSGEFTIGNYYGAIKNWVATQEEYNCIYSLVDLHAITVLQDPATLRKRTFEEAAILIAAGIDPEKSLLFVQSHVSAHAELGWILNCYSYMGELSRMTQFKDKTAKATSNESIRVGLFDYPVLMAADILLYQTDVVPVGLDQKQHLELARDIAQRFNQQYSPTFVVPEGYFGTSGAKINSLAAPEKKMSKSDENENAYILMKDSPDRIRNKFKRAVTDSETVIRYDRENKPGISNLLEIYSCAKKTTIEEAAKTFENENYGNFKLAVAEAVIEDLKPIQDRFDELVKEKEYVNKVLRESAEYASYLANKTLDKVKRKVGFYSTK